MRDSPVRRVPGFGRGGSISGIFKICRNAGGTVRCVTTSVISFHLSGLGLGACSRRSWFIRSLTVLGAEGVVEGEALELSKDGWT